MKYLLFFLLFTSIFIIYFGCIFLNWNKFYLGGLVLLYFVCQILFSILNYISYKNTSLENYPDISLNIVGYRENSEYWKNCLHSIIALDYPKDKIKCVYAMIDGNENDDIYMKTIFDDLFHEIGMNSKCILLNHKGKRNAMYEGFQHIKKDYSNNKYIVVIDSDTILENNSMTELVKAIEKNPKNGCGTGSLEIFNRNNILTKIIHARYGYAFNIERGAMSYVGCMNCCSGPFSIYRQELLDDELLDDFLSQKYCGKEVGPGDDRHLTNLILTKGYRSIQTPFAIAFTESPEFFYRFLKQQLRWMRSFYREQLWQIRAIRNQHFYLIIITIYELLFPFFIFLSFISHFYSEITFKLFIRRLIYAFCILLLRTFLLLGFKKCKLIYLYHLCYFPLYFFFLLPIKLYAISSCYKMDWITSDRKNIIHTQTFENIMISIFIINWNIFLCSSVLYILNIISF
jgi:cellulose synthase/poly-beta-1,6-N-acetylglucosamine synthase-like glycosyltransferase